MELEVLERTLLWLEEARHARWARSSELDHEDIEAKLYIVERIATLHLEKEKP